MTKKPQNTSAINHRILFVENQLNQYALEFLAEKIKEGLLPATIDNYLKTFQALSFVRLKDFDRRDFTEWLCEQLAHCKWAKNTLANRLRQLACFNRFLFYNSLVLRLHRAPIISLKPKRRELPIIEEWHLLFESLRQRYETSTLGRRKSRWRDYLVCRILHETGVRISEAARLRVGDLVIHSVGQYFLLILPEASELRLLKTEDSERAVIISEKLCDELRAYLWTFKIQNKRARMFTSKTGKDLDTIEFCKWVKDYAAKLNIGVEITPHLFRHNFIINFIASGGSALDLMARLGHADIKMTVYYFNQVRRLMPFAQSNPDISILENRYQKRAKHFQNKQERKLYE